MSEPWHAGRKRSAPEIRRDLILGHEVLVAPERLARPGALWLPAAIPSDAANCPFCAGHESRTPATLARYPQFEGESWRIRVVPNAFPACEPIGSPDLSGDTELDPGARATDRRPARGDHEVVIESPEHLTEPLQVPPADRPLVYRAWRDRFLAWRAVGQVRYPLAFKNQGPGAGASLPHVHSQLVGLSHVPKAVQGILHRAARYHQRTGSCAWCDRLERERSSRRRVILEDDQFLVYCPYASRFPYETWVVPRAHASHFEHVHPRPDERLAEIVSSVLARLEQSVSRLAFNLLFWSAPFDMPPSDHYHWHIVILPRYTRPGGFEWATRCWINPLLPEQAAPLLRAAQEEPTASCG